MNESGDSGIVSEGIVVEVNTMVDRRTVLKGVGCSRGTEEDREGGDGCFEHYRMSITLRVRISQKKC